MLHGAVERPRHNLQSTAVELAQEVGVLVVAQPYEEVSRSAVTVHIVAAAGTSVGAEAAVGNTHGICHTLDKGPERTVGAVGADTLRLKLVGMRKLMQEHAPRLEHQPRRVTLLAVGALDVARAVEDRDVAVRPSLGRDAVDVLQRVVYAAHDGDIILGRVVECRQHRARLLADIALGVGDDVAVDLRALGRGGLVLEDYLTRVVLLPRLRHAAVGSARPGARRRHGGCKQHRRNNFQIRFHGMLSLFVFMAGGYSAAPSSSPVVSE